MTRKRLVLFVEGEGDVAAAQVLTKRLIAGFPPEIWQSVALDDSPLRVGGIPKLLKNDGAEWRRQLANARKRSGFSAGLLVVDGDYDQLNRLPFCAVSAANLLTRHAQSIGAGTQFSVAVVVARQEFESWLIPGFVQLANSQAVDASQKLAVPERLEDAPRDAKKWIRQNRQGGYLPTSDQAELARTVDLDVIRASNLRSFRRFESAVNQLLDAICSGQHVSSPSSSP